MSDKPCGCFLQPTPDVLGWRVQIEYCPLHDAAPIGRELAEAVLYQDKHCWGIEWKPLVALARRFMEAAGKEER